MVLHRSVFDSPHGLDLLATNPHDLLVKNSSPPRLPEQDRLLSLAASQGDCVLFPGFFGYVVQALLALWCILVLYVKWKRESPQRPGAIFLRDMSKQIVGGMWVHVLNILCALLLVKRSVGPADECDWYWVNIMADTTLGVFVEYKLLRWSERWFGYKSGVYGVAGGRSFVVEDDVLLGGEGTGARLCQRMVLISCPHFLEFVVGWRGWFWAMLLVSEAETYGRGLSLRL